MALLDNMYAPYSHLMSSMNSRLQANYHQNMHQTASSMDQLDPSVTRLDVSSSSVRAASTTSADSSPPSQPQQPRTHYGGMVSLKLEHGGHQTHFRPYVSDSPGQENNINEDNRREKQVRPPR
jgi:hypothetical protein